MSRVALGIVALGLIGAGVGVLLWPGRTGDDLVTGGLLVRSGVVLAAIWLAFPNLQRVQPRNAVIGGALALLAIARPRLLLVGIPAALVLMALLAFNRRRR